MGLFRPIQWDLRETGSMSNGGGFAPYVPSPGTDYSQQDTPAVTGTDLEINSSNNKRIRSTSGLITSDHIGNVIYISSGTGFTPGRYTIYQDAGGGWFDVDPGGAAVGTTGSTGGTFAVGGALGGADFDTVFNEVFTNVETVHGSGSIDGSTLWVKKGTYTQKTPDISFGTIHLTSLVAIAGYNNTHGDLDSDIILSYSDDNLNRPTLNVDLSSGGAYLIQTLAASQIRNLIIKFLGTSSSTTSVFDATSEFPVYFRNIYIDSQSKCSTVFGSNIKTVIAEGLEIERVGTSPSSYVIHADLSQGGIVLNYCIIKNVTGRAIVLKNNATSFIAASLTNIVIDNTNYGMEIGADPTTAKNTGGISINLSNFIINQCTSGGIIASYEPNGLVIKDGIISNCGTGMSLSGTSGLYLTPLPNILNLAFYNNGTDVTASSSVPDHNKLINNKINLTSLPYDSSYTTTEKSLLEVGIQKNVIGLLKGGTGTKFSETLQPTRDRHWNISSGAIATVDNGVVSGEKISSGAVLGGGTSSNSAVQNLASSNSSTIHVSEDDPAVQRAISTGTFAAPGHALMRVSSKLAGLSISALLTGAANASNHDPIHRVASLSSEKMATQIRSGKWNFFDASFTGGRDAVEVAGAWDQTTDSDQASDLNASQTDHAAHTSKTRPGEFTYHYGGPNPKQNDYPQKNLF